MVRVGLIGFGLAGQAFHAPVIRGVPGMELACILERRGTRAQEKYPEVRVARTVEELLADKEIQLCVIATPNDSHFEWRALACWRDGMWWWTSRLRRRWEKLRNWLGWRRSAGA